MLLPLRCPARKERLCLKFHQEIRKQSGALTSSLINYTLLEKFMSCLGWFRLNRKNSVFFINIPLLSTFSWLTQKEKLLRLCFALFVQISAEMSDTVLQFFTHVIDIDHSSLSWVEHDILLIHETPKTNHGIKAV